MFQLNPNFFNQPNTLTPSLMHLSGDLAQSVSLSATSSLEKPALFLVELRGAPHHQVVPAISREMFGGEKLTQSSPLIPFNLALGNWKWCVFPHTTPCYLKIRDKIYCTHCSSRITQECTVGHSRDLDLPEIQEDFAYLNESGTVSPSIGRKNMYLFLITAICVFHSPSDTTKRPQINQQVTEEMS